MKFICLKYVERNQWKALTGKDREAFLQACRDFDNRLRESGHFFASESLQATGEPVGLTCFHGQLVVADEPHDKTDEVLGGLMLLEARDLNHAIILVSDHPGIRAGWFTIHPADDKGEMQ
ncbi:YciI family protein [Oligoflexus tunisiensis]|uniref:YciI family protein n=1 Tax=Oligoflexus tunisiensis TaxID=708132 RepID=UPI000A98BBED|nr:YciI family protein [Oligoflexus tunisiensis]